ncbi:hypothetical protein CHLRE_16g675750v5 [Chlamydomonas reinhardtii]|uniref:Protein kinase domain-containing protein n=1 Tax=Chlamydomonas reinhardtii TaxID=3055 RepID=A0A2K3CVE6_CHLRE|nr:uncharacterized protein CHLRE_16g675750v5 [Chlamydomonas reinhardtii]PNW72252.1 hypothetical protein CHLRE_16g675750v5 [Chlamydomonas reinhardtii]
MLKQEHLKIKAHLGAGGFARVFRAEYEGVEVALKVLAPANINHADPAAAEEYATAKELFTREGRLLLATHHPHIVRCLAMGPLPAASVSGLLGSDRSFAHHQKQPPPAHAASAGGGGATTNASLAPAMALEMCEPYTPRQLIMRGMASASKTYSTYTALEWLLQIASALAHLHSQKPIIIHRDVKCENILLKKDKDGKLVAKLADLGLCVVVEQDRSVMLRKKSERRLHVGTGAGGSSGGGSGTASPALHLSLNDAAAAAAAAGGGCGVSAAPVRLHTPSRIPTAGLNDLARGGSDSPFLTISAGHSAAASRVASRAPSMTAAFSSTNAWGAVGAGGGGGGGGGGSYSSTQPAGNGGISNGAGGSAAAGSTATESLFDSNIVSSGGGVAGGGVLNGLRVGPTGRASSFLTQRSNLGLGVVVVVGGGGGGGGGGAGSSVSSSRAAAGGAASTGGVTGAPGGGHIPAAGLAASGRLPPAAAAAGSSGTGNGVLQPTAAALAPRVLGPPPPSHQASVMYPPSAFASATADPAHDTPAASSSCYYASGAATTAGGAVAVNLPPPPPLLPTPIAEEAERELLAQALTERLSKLLEVRSCSATGVGGAAAPPAAAGALLGSTAAVAAAMAAGGMRQSTAGGAGMQLTPLSPAGSAGGACVATQRDRGVPGGRLWDALATGDVAAGKEDAGLSAADAADAWERQQQQAAPPATAGRQSQPQQQPQPLRPATASSSNGGSRGGGNDGWVPDEASAIGCSSFGGCTRPQTPRGIDLVIMDDTAHDTTAASGSPGAAAATTQHMGASNLPGAANLSEYPKAPATAADSTSAATSTGADHHSNAVAPAVRPPAVAMPSAHPPTALTAHMTRTSSQSFSGGGGTPRADADVYRGLAALSDCVAATATAAAIPEAAVAATAAAAAALGPAGGGGAAAAAIAAAAAAGATTAAGPAQHAVAVVAAAGGAADVSGAAVAGAADSVTVVARFVPDEAPSLAAGVPAYPDNATAAAGGVTASASTFTTHTPSPPPLARATLHSSSSAGGAAPSPRHLQQQQGSHSPSTLPKAAVMASGGGFDGSSRRRAAPSPLLLQPVGSISPPLSPSPSAGFAGGGGSVPSFRMGGSGIPSPSTRPLASPNVPSETFSTISTMIAQNPEIVEEVHVEAPQSGLRMLGSLLKQLGKRELAPLRRQQMEWVYGLTGKAGSAMYMAPEVFQKLPYNEKADVFSFGVVMYELLARELLIVSVFNTGKAARLGVYEPIDYAELVADGYRPERTRALSDGMCALVAACWHEDPVQRPGMAEVERRLAALLLEEEARGGGARGGGGGASPGCGCTIS